MSRPWKHPETGVYWLRKRVPAELRALVGKREEKLSLRTKSPAEAKVLHAAALASVEERWSNLRRPIYRLAEADLIRATRASERAVVDAGGIMPGITWNEDVALSMWSAQVHAWQPGDAIGIGLAVKTQLQEDWCRKQAHAYAAGLGLSVEDGQMRELAKALSQGVQSGLAIVHKRQLGDFTASLPPLHMATRPSEAFTASVPFDALLEGWAAEKAPTTKTLYSWGKVVKQLCEFVGHTDASRLTPDDLLSWKAALLASGLRTKTIRDSKLAPLRAILQWGIDNRKLLQNAAARIQIDVRGKLTDRIRGFSDEEASLILRHAGEALDPIRRWIPLLCAYSGARLSEVCQLRKEDVLRQEGVWCVKFVPEAGSLKNESSERLVPLHPAILDAGFVDFVASRSSGPLFLALGADRFGNRGGNGTKVIGKWVRSLGIVDERISPSHSWRHRFKTLGRRYGLMPDIVNAITGHHRKTVADAYGEYPVSALNREMLKIPGVKESSSLEQAVL